MSVPVLHKYLSRSEVRRLFENEHFEKPAEFKGTLFENYVYISEHWLCLYHHFILRDKAAYIWERRGGMHESFKPFILNILYATGDITGFPGDDMRTSHAILQTAQKEAVVITSIGIGWLRPAAGTSRLKRQKGIIS